MRHQAPELLSMVKAFLCIAAFQVQPQQTSHGTRNGTMKESQNTDLHNLTLRITRAMVSEELTQNLLLSAC